MGHHGGRGTAAAAVIVATCLIFPHFSLYLCEPPKIETVIFCGRYRSLVKSHYFCEASFWRGQIDPGWERKKVGPIVKLAGSAQTLFCVVFFLRCPVYSLILLEAVLLKPGDPYSFGRELILRLPESQDSLSVAYPPHKKTHYLPNPTTLPPHRMRP